MTSDHYIDGFLAAVPTANKDAYRQHAATAAALFKAFGALQIVECWGDDVPQGQLTSMPMAVQCQPDETVAFSWVVWPSKAVRDAGWQKLMNDPRMPKGPTAKLLAVSTVPQRGCITRRVWTAIVMLLPFKADKVRRPSEALGGGRGFEVGPRMPFDGKRVIYGGFVPLLVEG